MTPGESDSAVAAAVMTGMVSALILGVGHGSATLGVIVLLLMPAAVYCALAASLGHWSQGAIDERAAEDAERSAKAMRRYAAAKAEIDARLAEIAAKKAGSDGQARSGHVGVRRVRNRRCV